MMRQLGVAALLLLSTVYADDTPKVQRADDIKLRAGVHISSVMERRGARLYDGLYLAPSIYLTLFEDHLVLQFPSLTVQHQPTEYLRGRAVLEYVTDKPLIRTSGPLGITNTRKDAVELTLAVDLYAYDIRSHWFSFGMQYSKGLGAHAGDYYQVSPRLSLGRYAQEEGPDGKKLAWVQPHLFGTLGYGDDRYNTYQYGTVGKVKGICYLAGGVLFTSPMKSDPSVPLVEIYYYRVMGDSQFGKLVSNSMNSGVQLNVNVTFQIF